MLIKKYFLKNKVIIITGGAGLLGKQFSKIIAEAHGTPVILDININKSKKICDYLNLKYNCDSMHFKCNVTDEQQVKKCFKKIVRIYNKKKIFGLINNAAFNPQPSKKINNSLELFDLRKWNSEIIVGLTGSFICTKIFGTHFSRQKEGSIINISSDLGIKAPKQSLYSHLKYIKPVTYSVVKHGIIGLTKYTCAYWAKNGVRCNTLAPGGVFNNQGKIFINKIKKEIPASRMANVNDFDGIVLYLLSDDSKYTNGSFISVDGGRGIS